MNDKDIKMISCEGYLFSMIYKNNGDLFVLGYNDHGQLGLNDTIDRFKPTLLMNDKEIRSIHCGHSHSLIYKNNGDLFVFGYNQNSQLGLNDNIDRYKPILLLNNPSIININGHEIKMIWSCENHKYYTFKFKQSIFLFYLCLKRYRNIGFLDLYHLKSLDLLICKY